MSAKPKPNENSGKPSKRKAMPFEPRSTQSEKEVAKPAKETTASAKPNRNQPSPKRPAQSSTKEGIPEVVSRRMVKRIALFCGIPTALGMSTFVASYVLVSNDWVNLPNYAVLLVSLGWFGLGVLGVSYGLLSTSWDEEIPGSWLGISEFRTNFGRMKAAWKENSRQSK